MKGTARLISIVGIATFLAAGIARAAEAPEAEPEAKVEPAEEKGVAADAAPAEAPATMTTVEAQTLQDTLHVQLTEIHEQVNDAKERSHLAKMRLHTFNEEVLKNLEPPGGARLTITHRNEMASGFKMTGIAYALDGAQVYSKIDLSGALDERGQIPIIDAKVIPGEHQLVVQYDVKGDGAGFFSYLNDLRVQLRRAYNFKVDVGKETRLVGTLGTSNNLTDLYQDRPNISFNALVVDLPKPKGPAVIASASPPADQPPADAPAQPPVEIPAAVQSLPPPAAETK